MGQTIRYIAYILGVALVLTIIFVRAGQKGGMSGGTQSSLIIGSAASGISQIGRTFSGGD